MYHIRQVSIIQSLKYVENVNLDGCSPFQSLPSLTCRNDDIEHIYNGTDTEFKDADLHPYSGGVVFTFYFHFVVVLFTSLYSYMYTCSIIVQYIL